MLLTPSKMVQGGAGLGAALSAMQIVSDRPTIWATAQYLSFAAGTEPIDISVAVEVAGRNTTQARCVLAATGSRSSPPMPRSGHALARSTARGSSPGGSGPRRVRAVPVLRTRPGRCCGDLVEFRLAHGRHLDEIERQQHSGDGWFALWVRCWQGRQPVRIADLDLHR